MISLIIPPKDQISRISKMLADEFGTASNIKSRVNRLSVLGAITSVQHRLKLYTKGKDILHLILHNEQKFLRSLFCSEFLKSKSRESMKFRWKCRRLIVKPIV